ncbi:MAG: OmpA family protein [Bacteroidota bacterium]
MKKFSSFLLILFVCFANTIVLAQKVSPSSLYDDAAHLYDKKDFINSLSAIGKAIELKKDEPKYILLRAMCYDKLTRRQEAINDYITYLSLGKSDEEVHLAIANNLFYSGKIDESKKILSALLFKNAAKENIPDYYYNAVARKNKKGEIDELDVPKLSGKGELDVAQKLMSRCYLSTSEFDKALELSKKVIEIDDKDFEAYHIKGNAEDSLKKYHEANASYSIAVGLLKQMPSNIPEILPFYKPYVASLAFAQHKDKIYTEASKNYLYCITKDFYNNFSPRNDLLNYRLALVYVDMNNYSSAINHVNTAIGTNDNFIEAFKLRAELYKKTGQLQSAINDYTKLILSFKKADQNYFERGTCYLDLGKYADAVKDLKEHTNLFPKDSLAKAKLVVAKQKLYEENRETIAPKLRILKPKYEAETESMVIAFNKSEVVIHGEIWDDSPIKSIKINGVEASYLQEQKNPSFMVVIPVNGKERVEFSVTDDYNNVTNQVIKINWVEPKMQADFKVDMRGFVMAEEVKGKAVGKVLVKLLNEKGEVVQTTFTNELGEFVFKELPPDVDYIIAIDAHDTEFKNTQRFVITNDKGKESAVAFNKDGNFKFEMLAYDFSSMSLMKVEDSNLSLDLTGKLLTADDARTPLLNLPLVVYNSKGEIVAKTQTDEFGFFVFKQLPPDDNYVIAIDNSANNLSFTQRILMTDAKGKVLKEIGLGADGKFKFVILPADKLELSSFAAVDPWLKIRKLVDDKNEITIVENIYYESGKFLILPEAETVLNKVITALEKNPDFIAEISAHTDSRAGDDVNMKLSQKRADECVKYIVSKGIDKSRVKGFGFGETKLLNECGNSSTCSDLEHRKNRRTEFKIISKK